MMNVFLDTNILLEITFIHQKNFSICWTKINGISNTGT